MAQYAYGADEVDCIGCPVIQSGIDEFITKGGRVGGEIDIIVEDYDDAVAAYTDEYEGVVSEDIARQAWSDIIRYWQDRYHGAGATDEQEWAEENLEKAERVASALGWEVPAY